MSELKENQREIDERLEDLVKRLKAAEVAEIEEEILPELLEVNPLQVAGVIIADFDQELRREILLSLDKVRDSKADKEVELRKAEEEMEDTEEIGTTEEAEELIAKLHREQRKLLLIKKATRALDDLNINLEQYL